MSKQERFQVSYLLCMLNVKRVLVDPERQHGGSQDTRRELDSAEESGAELSTNERAY